MEKKLYRSRSERVVAGVAGGLAQYFEIDPTLVRAAVVLLGLVTHGGILIAYLIMAVVVPEEPVSEEPVAEGTSAPAVPYVASQPPSEEGFTVTENDTRSAAPMPEQAPAPPAPAAPTPPQYVAPASPPPAAPQPVAPRARGTRGLWWGLTLIVVGMILLADQFLPGVSLWQYWPLVIVAIGLATVIKGVRR